MPKEVLETLSSLCQDLVPWGKGRSHTLLKMLLPRCTAPAVLGPETLWSWGIGDKPHERGRLCGPLLMPLPALRWGELSLQGREGREHWLR